MARDPRIMHVEKRDGELHILSDEELDEKEAVQRVVVRMFFIISIILGPGLMGSVDLFSDYHPSYVGAFVIANAITTALTIVVKYPDRSERLATASAIQGTRNPPPPRLRRGRCGFESYPRSTQNSKARLLRDGLL